MNDYAEGGLGRRLVRVLTMSCGVPEATLDSVLSAVEGALMTNGARHVWIEPDGADLCVLAEFGG